MSLNNIFLNLYKKAERLSSAVFLVSDTISGFEELKTKIRHLAISFISYCSIIKDNTPAEKIKLIPKMESTLLEMASFINMACLSGLVSPMNNSILKQEFNLLIEDLNELSKYCRGVEISNDFFKLNNDSAVLLGHNNINTQESIKDNKTWQKDKNNRKEHREKAIIDFIRSKGSVNIKDISKSIKGCSEKTLQRKLISLIEKGVIKKQGERRWSRYSLI